MSENVNDVKKVYDLLDKYNEMKDRVLRENKEEMVERLTIKTDDSVKECVWCNKSFEEKDRMICVGGNRIELFMCNECWVNDRFDYYLFSFDLIDELIGKEKFIKRIQEYKS